MKRVWAVADSIVSPLGNTTRENFHQVSLGSSGVKPLSPAGHEMIFAGVIDDLNGEEEGLTSFEKICVQALSSLQDEVKFEAPSTLLILSTTKGNIELLQNGSSHSPKVSLVATGTFLQKRFGFAEKIIVSNACVSGVLALIMAKRFIEAGYYNDVVVLGADVLSRFVISGFQSLLALSNEPCRPFDEHRRGINLGEGAGAVLLSSSPEKFQNVRPIRILAGGTSNDANHISGPSRTGEELALAVSAALEAADLTTGAIDFISAHGTATLYNDEMEAKAFDLCGLAETPVHSLKGYYGHTLGAAGVIETIIGMEGLRNGILIPCLGFSSLGVSRRLNVITQKKAAELKTFLKTSSGFGGCNAAIVLQKEPIKQ